MTPWQMFTNDFKPQRLRLRPFGEVGFVLIEKDQRGGKLENVRERALYLCNGHLNPLQNKFTDMPQAHIMLYSNRGNIKTTNKVLWTSDMTPEIKEIVHDQDPPSLPHIEPRTVDRNDPRYDEIAKNIGYEPQLDNTLPENVKETAGPRPQAVPKPKHILLGPDNEPMTLDEYLENERPLTPAERRMYDEDAADYQGPPPYFPPPEEPTSPEDVALECSPLNRRPRNQPSRFQSDFGADGNWNENNSLALNYHHHYMLALPSLYELYISEEPISFVSRDSKDTLSAARFRKYSHANNVCSFFRLGGKINDFRHDLNFGKFIFDDPHLHTLQYMRGANWLKLSAGGVHDSLKIPHKLPKQVCESGSQPEQLLLRAIADHRDAKALHMTIESYHTTKYHPEALIYCNGSQVENLFGATYDTDEYIRDYLGLHLFREYNKPEYYDRQDDNIQDTSPPSIWLALHLVSPKEIIIDQHELVDLKKVPLEQRPAMLEAITKEVTDLCKVGAFELVKPPPYTKPISSRIVLKLKTRADGSIDKFKARLVARGFLARLGNRFLRHL